MSGICGFFAFDDRPVDAHTVDRMTDAIRTWGSASADAPCFVARSARVGLGARVASITPEDAYDRQPLRSADGRLTIVADARLDNRPELAAALGWSGREAANMPDSACILRAWEAWGDDTPRHLIGDFAFAVWDEHNQVLNVVRDHLGQRVIFYHRTATRLALASSPRALLSLPDVPRRLDQQKLGELLVDIQDSERTCLDGILRVPPAHVLRVAPEGITLRRYWRLDPNRRLRLRTDDDYLAAFRDTFDRAVRDRIRSAHPVAATLSAGLDSSAVVGVAARELQRTNRRLFAYHAAPPLGTGGETRAGWAADESDDVVSAAQMHENIDLTVLRGPWRTPLEDATPHFEVMFAPIRNAANLSWFLGIYGAAREVGARVLLTGGKGNYTISTSGVRWLHELARKGHMLATLRELRAFAKANGRSPWDVLKYHVLRPFVPVPLIAAYDRARGLPRPAPVWEDTLSPINPELARTLRLDERRTALGFDDMSASRWRWNQDRLIGLTDSGDSFDVSHALRDMFGIETREPTTDVRVVEFCLSLPGSQFLDRGTDRRLVRRSMRDVVPAAVLDRTTRGAQAADWTLWMGPMRGTIAAELDALNGVALARECLDLPRLQRLVREWPTTLQHAHFPEYGLRLLRGLMMGRFIRWFEETWT